MRVQVINEIKQSELSVRGSSDAMRGWELCFQRCRYVYDEGTLKEGYRFIWRTPEGKLQPARGQARLPSVTLAKRFMDRAIEEGWGGEEFI